MRQLTARYLPPGCGNLTLWCLPGAGPFELNRGLRTALEKIPGRKATFVLCVSMGNHHCGKQKRVNPAYLPEFDLRLDVLADTIRQGAIFSHLVWMACGEAWGFSGEC